MLAAEAKNSVRRGYLAAVIYSGRHARARESERKKEREDCVLVYRLEKNFARLRRAITCKYSDFKVNFKAPGHRRDHSCIVGLLASKYKVRSAGIQQEKEAKVMFKR